MTILSNTSADSLLYDILAKSSLTANVSILWTGDSLAELIVGETVNREEFISAALAQGVTVDLLTDAAVSGSFLMYSNNTALSWWRDDNNTKGAYYTSILDPIADKETYTDLIISLTRNDTSFTQSVTAIKAAWNGFLTQLRSDFPNVERFYLKPLMRHPSLDDSTNIARWEAYRTAMYEFVDDNADIHMLSECYDLATQDNTHLTDANELIDANRTAKSVAFKNGTYNKPMRGMEITAAADNIGGVLATITHHDGTDFTIPETPDTDILFRVEYDGGQVVDLSAVDMSRVSGNQILIETGALAYPEKLHTMYGTMFGVANNVEPKVPLDNSPSQLPFTRSKVLITGGANAIDDITNLDFYLRPDAAKTYSTGVKVLTVADQISGEWSNWNTGNEMEFIASAFGGLGGFNSPVTSGYNYRLRKAFTWSSTMFFGSVLSISETVAGDGAYVFQAGGGGAGAPSLFARLFVDTSGKLFYGTNNTSTSTLIDLGGDYRGGTYAFIANYVSLSQLDIYVYDKNGLVASHSIDPNDNYQSRNFVYFGGATTDVTNGILLGKNESHSVSDPSIGAIANQLLRDHNALI